jgi:DNA-binding transcriptional MerR regulator
MSDSLELSPAVAFVRSLPGEFFMLREVAEIVGVSQYTLRSLIANDTEGLTPSNFAMFGNVKIYLYTRDDIKRLEKHFERRLEVLKYNGQSAKVGRPALYTKDERRERNRLHSASYYYKTRYEALSAAERTEDAKIAFDKHMAIETRLKELWPIKSK